MNASATIDAQRLTLMLNELRLPAIKQIWGDFAERADKEGWPAARFLSIIAEHELAERDRRRIERHLAEAHLPAGKTLEIFAFDAVPMIWRPPKTAGAWRHEVIQSASADEVRDEGIGAFRDW